MKRILKKLLLITVLLLAVGMMLGASNAAQAKTKNLKTKTIKAGKSVNLKVKGEADWAISNTQVANMTVLNASTAKITGKQPGSTSITAKVGSTVYRATIKVKGAAKSSGGGGGKIEGLSSSPIPGSKDTAYYTNTGSEVVGHFDDSFANDIVAKTNSYRSSNGASSLRGNSSLVQAARTRAVESVVRFQHTRPNGKPYWSVGGSEKESPVYGENLAYGYNNASETMSAWIASTMGHRENLVRGSFVSIGVAVIWVKQADGGYTAYIAQEFGS